MLTFHNSNQNSNLNDRCCEIARSDSNCCNQTTGNAYTSRCIMITEGTRDKSYGEMLVKNFLNFMCSTFIVYIFYCI